MNPHATSACGAPDGRVDRKAVASRRTPKLLLQVDGGLGDFVESGDGLGVGLIIAFSEDQLCELRGDVHVGLFQCTAAD